MIRATAPASGTLQSLMVREGDAVPSGARIAVISISTETSAGNVGEMVAKGLRSEAVAARAKAESQLAHLEVEREQSNIRLSKSEAEHKQISMIQIALQEQAPPACTATNMKRGVEIAKKGFLPRREVDSRRLAVLAAEQELATHHRRACRSTESAIADIKARLASIPLEIDAARSEASTAEARSGSAPRRSRGPPASVRHRACQRPRSPPCRCHDGPGHRRRAARSR